MLKVFRTWVDTYFSDEEAVILLIIMLAGLVAVVLWGDIMAPVIASVILAFILQGLVNFLIRHRANPKFAVIFAFTLFASAVLAIILELIPLVWGQLVDLVKNTPSIFESLKTYLAAMQTQYPDLVNTETIDSVYQEMSSEAAGFGQWVVSYSLESLPALIEILIYFVVVPILVFFFLKDKDKMIAALGNMLPNDRPLMETVWEEMNEQFANYVRGKVVEIVVVGGATYVAFAIMGLNYAALLAILVGFSVVIPYIGAVLVTIPVVIIALFQYGLESEFYYLIFAYLIIQVLDGNVLVPLLFSEVNNLHPVVIIISVLFFGGVWGVWGVFFAIPLATMLKAVFTAWPKKGYTPVKPPKDLWPIEGEKPYRD